MIGLFCSANKLIFFIPKQIASILQFVLEFADRLNTMVGIWISLHLQSIAERKLQRIEIRYSAEKEIIGHM